MDHRLSRIRSERSMHHWEKKYLVWNHGNWTTLDRLKRRQERRALKDSLRRMI